MTMKPMPIRVDRFLTVRLFGPLARLNKSKGLRIPILMYHSICDERETTLPYYRVNTSPMRFAEHMKWLHDNGYEVIGLSAAVALISGQPSETATGKQQPHPKNLQGVLPSDRPMAESADPTCRKYVVLTFDDGYRDFYTEAFPVLKRYGYTSTVFLPTAFIDGGNRGLLGKQHLSWKQVQQLHAEGVAFGSHTVNHPQLSHLKLDEVDDELRRSKEIIEAHMCQSTGARVKLDSFCYPFKFPDHDRGFVRSLRSRLEDAGYGCCATTRVGTMAEGEDSFFLKRIPANSLDDPGFFELKLEGGYDWLGKVQYGWKSIVRNKVRG